MEDCAVERHVSADQSAGHGMGGMGETGMGGMGETGMGGMGETGTGGMGEKESLGGGERRQARRAEGFHGLVLRH